MTDPASTETSVRDAVAAARRQREIEQRVVGHVVSLIQGRDFIVPTLLGPKPVNLAQPKVSRWSQGANVKKALVSAGQADFDLQDAMPKGAGLDVSLGRQVLMAFRQPIGQVRFASLPPWEDLAKSQPLRPMTSEAIRRRVQELPAPGDSSVPPSDFGGPMTLILFSGSGFSPDARRVAREFRDGPPTILIEPNDVGGYQTSGPDAAAMLMQALNPETADEQISRVSQELEKRRVDLLTGGVALDRIAQETKLPLGAVEQAAAAWSRRAGEPLRIKRVDGGSMLFRDESISTGSAASASASGTIPVMDRLRRMFGGTASAERRIAQLAEQRAALARQRDRHYDEMSRLEEREAEMMVAFKSDESENLRRRITSQLVQLRKDIARRRQTVGVINQQINVVGSHLHNLELARSSTTAGKLPTVDELADDAAKAEEVLADLQVSSEMADELTGVAAAAGGLSAEEQAIYDELASTPEEPAAEAPAFAREIPVAPKTQPTAVVTPEPEAEASEPAKPMQQKQAEAG
jgi:hypothetical protein